VWGACTAAGTTIGSLSSLQMLSAQVNGPDRCQQQHSQANPQLGAQLQAAAPAELVHKGLNGLPWLIRAP
jgi:hypothetical protein